MVNRFLLIGAGVVLGGGMFAFAAIRDVEAARDNPETVIALDGEEAATADPALLQKPTPTKGTVLYACPGGRAFAVSFDQPGGRATMTLKGDRIVMDPVFVAVGAQFTDGIYTFRASGEMAAVVLGGNVLFDGCRISHQSDVAQASAGGS
jgi:membrane-bound inhibitor of C-type lysozyme